MQNLGEAGRRPRRPRQAAAPRRPAAAAPPAPLPPAAARPAAARAAEALDDPAAVEAVAVGAADHSTARGVVGRASHPCPAAEPPRCPPQTLQRAVVVAARRGLDRRRPPAPAAILRSRAQAGAAPRADGQQVKRDFLMLAVTHGGDLTPEDQQRILQGGDSGPLGRDLPPRPRDGWLRPLRTAPGRRPRDAPLPSGGVTTTHH